jgi:hypothetical protein
MPVRASRTSSSLNGLMMAMTIFILVDDRGGGITGTHEIGMQRVHRPVGRNGPLRRHKRLADHLAAKDTLPSDLRACSAEQVLFEPFNVEA